MEENEVQEELQNEETKVFVNESSLTGIANAIRTKLNTQDTFYPSDMTDAILSISGETPLFGMTIFWTENVVGDDTKYIGDVINNKVDIPYIEWRINNKSGTSKGTQLKRINTSNSWDEVEAQVDDLVLLTGLFKTSPSSSATTYMYLARIKTKVATETTDTYNGTLNVLVAWNLDTFRRRIGVWADDIKKDKTILKLTGIYAPPDPIISFDYSTQLLDFNFSSVSNIIEEEFRMTWDHLLIPTSTSNSLTPVIKLFTLPNTQTEDSFTNDFVGLAVDISEQKTYLTLTSNNQTTSLGIVDDATGSTGEFYTNHLSDFNSLIKMISHHRMSFNTSPFTEVYNELNTCVLCYLYDDPSSPTFYKKLSDTYNYIIIDNI